MGTAAANLSVAESLFRKYFQKIFSVAKLTVRSKFLILSQLNQNKAVAEGGLQAPCEWDSVREQIFFFICNADIRMMTNIKC